MLKYRTREKKKVLVGTYRVPFKSEGHGDCWLLNNKDVG
jgi:hypothetical protein